MGREEAGWLLKEKEPLWRKGEGGHALSPEELPEPPAWAVLEMTFKTLLSFF